MTPIAHALAKDSTLPRGKRLFADAAEEFGIFDDLHFFEVSQVWDAANQIARGIGMHGLRGMRNKLGFLPAPRTWLEFASSPTEKSPGGRIAWLLEAKGHESATLRAIFLGADHLSISRTGAIAEVPLRDSEEKEGVYTLDTQWWDGISAPGKDCIIALIYSLLAMINTPRVIGRKQHMPHRGLERRLIASRPMVGKFPLMGWTEILLHVTPPDVTGDSSSSREAHLTGERALHFCRCHLRIRLGQLELVSAHWRGDAALGIKRSRYTVAA